MKTKITPSDLRAESARLIATNQMPSLDKLLQAVFETRAKYVPLILKARKENS